MCSRNNVAGERNRRDCDFDFDFECNHNRNHCCRDNDDVAGERNRRDCDCVFRCLEELLEGRFEENNRRSGCCFR